MATYLSRGTPGVFPGLYTDACAGYVCVAAGCRLLETAAAVVSVRNSPRSLGASLAFVLRLAPSCSQM